VRGLKKAEQLPPLETTLTPVDPEQTPVLEVDELWSFVFSTTIKVWSWVVLNRQTREIIAYACGDRSEETCRILWGRIPLAYKKGVVFSGYWKAYQAVIPDQQHNPMGKETGETAHVERWNNTLRQHLVRFQVVLNV